MNSPKCPKCNSEKIHSFDNQPLDHTFNGDSQYPCYDREIYVSFKCNDCGNTFEKVFNLVLQDDKINEIYKEAENKFGETLSKLNDE